MKARQSIVVAAVAALVCLATAVSASSPVEDAFKKFFGDVAANATTKAVLAEHLDTLLKLGTYKPGDKLKFVHDYHDKLALQAGTGLVPSLDAGSDGNKMDAWADQIMGILPQMEEKHAYPFLRRLVVAALLRVWLHNGNSLPPTASGSKLAQLMVKLYDKHRKGSIHKGTMEFLHVSKSGGTSWCHIAQLNGCVTERYDKSYVCQIKKFDDKVRWLNMSFHLETVPAYRIPKYVLKRFSRYGTFRKRPEMGACPARHKYVHVHDYSYYSNEYTVHGGAEEPEGAHLCRDLYNAVVMRDPLKRLVSHMKFIMWTMSGDRGYNDTHTFNLMYSNRTSDFWKALGPAVVDNYFIRSLLGERAFHAPVGGVTPAMLGLAQQVLAQFDTLVVLEQDVATRNLILYYGLGWRHTMEEVHDKDSAQREALFDTSPYIPADVDALLAAQGLDLQLYAFSKTLALLDPVVFDVAQASGQVPLRQIAAAKDTDNLECGLLRGNNNSEAMDQLREDVAAGGGGVRRRLTQAMEMVEAMGTRGLVGGVRRAMSGLERWGRVLGLQRGRGEADGMGQGVWGRDEEEKEEEDGGEGDGEDDMESLEEAEEEGSGEGSDGGAERRSGAGAYAAGRGVGVVGTSLRRLLAASGAEAAAAAAAAAASAAAAILGAWGWGTETSSGHGAASSGGGSGKGPATAAEVAAVTLPSHEAAASVGRQPSAFEAAADAAAAAAVAAAAAAVATVAADAHFLARVTRPQPPSPPAPAAAAAAALAPTVDPGLMLLIATAGPHTPVFAGSNPSLPNACAACGTRHTSSNWRRGWALPAAGTGAAAGACEDSGGGGSWGLGRCANLCNRCGIRYKRLLSLQGSSGGGGGGGEGEGGTPAAASAAAVDAFCRDAVNPWPVLPPALRPAGSLPSPPEAPPSPAAAAAAAAFSSAAAVRTPPRVTGPRTPRRRPSQRRLRPLPPPHLMPLKRAAGGDAGAAASAMSAAAAGEATEAAEQEETAVSAAAAPSEAAAAATAAAGTKVRGKSSGASVTAEYGAGWAEAVEGLFLLWRGRCGAAGGQQAPKRRRPWEGEEVCGERGRGAEAVANDTPMGALLLAAAAVGGGRVRSPRQAAGRALA
ncbi:hypothetical protein HYH03_005012 [Edaphochlamys debaryana]|uniref:GATA-type domain-containing protein n=1 Tax=Edaphochlamys debaryana TaxID=47281 RepID=A0A836C2S0_9CHLO|nr:hypothetical protein HYH03_005012 [Edaphochlamys debaryana]|eukprot:KAG2497008.1 hypothetical protein HYH03_005012 [Edaphochlamys debaryana]